jgi:hypothetical protein
MVRQFIPFVRLDGYWMLADLTGIPDFLTLAGLFARGAVPAAGAGQKGSKLPELKPWVKAVFVTYIAITIPLLLFLFVRMFVDLPRFLMMTRDALLVQTRTLAGAQSSGDFLTIVLVGVQIFFLPCRCSARSTFFTPCCGCRSARSGTGANRRQRVASWGGWALPLSQGLQPLSGHRRSGA